MDSRYQWPPLGYGNNQHPPPAQGNGYPGNDYPMQSAPQPMPQQYPQSQPIQGQPRMANYPPRQNQPYAGPRDEMRPAPPRNGQPQFVIQARNMGNMAGPLAAMQNPRIRQVQVPVQRSPQQGHRPNMAPTQSRGHQGQTRQHQAPTAVSKPIQRPRSFQENPPRLQEPPSSSASVHQPQQRVPLQPHTTPQQRRPPPSTPSGQHRSPALPQTPSSQQKSHPRVLIKKTTPQSMQSQSGQQYAPPQALPVDLSVLLLQLADEYIDAAHVIGPLAAKTQGGDALDQYHTLMATGLGCMETALKNFNHTPRTEAMLRLRYASLLIEETDNPHEIEEVLSKGIALCSRSRLLDLKYSMQHLQARHEFKTNHRAALKSLDAPIGEAETFQHIVWVYAFRFLKVSLALRVPGRPESASTLQQLHAIANHAEKRGDRAIFVTASALEAMVHLRTAGPDHIEHAQRAIAAARSYQLQASTKEVGQIAAFIDIVDIACSLRKGTLDRQKMNALQQRADEESGPGNGVFSVLIEKSFGGQSLTQSTGGIFKKANDGRDELVFSWLPKNDFAMLAYYLSGVMLLPNDMSRGCAYLQEGLGITKDALQRHSKYANSIPASIAQRSWVMNLDWHMWFALGLVACRADDILQAKQALASLRKRPNKGPFKDEDFSRLVSYLAGVVAQSTGELDGALDAYSSPELMLPATSPHIEPKTDLQILAAMNKLLIVRSPAHPEHHLTQTLFAQLEKICLSHPNQYIVCAFCIIRAIQNDDTSINRQKTLASNAANMAKSLQNVPFIALGLSLLTSRFLTDTVSEQAIKSARASRALSKQAKTLLWRAVAYGQCMHTFQRNGLHQDAEDCRNALAKLESRLPEPLIETLKIRDNINGSEDVLMTG